MERAEAIWEETDLDPSVLLATNYIEFELSENNGTLSNGDVITLTASIDKEGIKNNIFYTKSLMGRKSQSFEFVVYGLEDGVILDVFDAIDCCYYDTTNETNSYYIQLKDDYSKDYNNGVTIVTENDEIKVYGEDFYSFSIPISFMSDKVSKDAKETKIQVDISYDSHIDKGIIIKETEKNITIDKLTYIKSNIFKENDLNILQKHALEFAAKKFDINKYHLSEVTLFTGGNLKSQALIYFFKGSDGVYIVFYEYLKCDTKNKVFNVANVEPQTRSGILWGTYKYSSMDKFYEVYNIDKNDNMYIPKEDRVAVW